MRGRSSKPSMSSPHSSLVDHWAGPRTAVWPAPRGPVSAVARRAAAGQEHLGPGVLEERVALRVDERQAFVDQGRDPERVVAVDGPGELEEGADVGGAASRLDLELGHGGLLRVG